MSDGWAAALVALVESELVSRGWVSWGKASSARQTPEGSADLDRLSLTVADLDEIRDL